MCTLISGNLHFRCCGTGKRFSNRHDDVIKWKHFPRYWPFVRGIHRSPVNSAHKGRWRGALMFSSICLWINDWVNTREAGDLRRYRAYYDVTVMRKETSCLPLLNTGFEPRVSGTESPADWMSADKPTELLKTKLNIYRVLKANYIKMVILKDIKKVQGNDVILSRSGGWNIPMYLLEKA